MMFSAQILSLLQSAGWRDDRRIDTEKYKMLFENTHQPYSQGVLEFLERFGDLYVNHPNHTLAHFSHYFYIDPVEAITEISVATIERYAVKLGRSLCVIGDVYQGSLLMAGSGEVYSVFDEYIALLGESGMAAIEAIASKNESTNVPEINTFAK